MAETSPGQRVSRDSLQPNPLRVDPTTGLPLPDPFPEYVICPHCGEAEVEAWCYQLEVCCHRCGQVIPHTPPPTCGQSPYCKRGAESENKP